MDHNGKGLLAQQFKANIEATQTVKYYLILVYEGKAKQADQVNQKLITKYEGLQKFIQLSSASDA